MLKIGKISYLNVFPLYSNLEDFQLVEGEPAKLNKLLQNRAIDISPSSSFEYILNHSNYLIINGLSISSKQKVLSVNLLLKKDIYDLDNDEIYLSPASSTSNALAKIILYNFLNKRDVKFKMLEQNRFCYNKNQLLIGDEALNLYFSCPEGYYLYDLAELWYQKTGLPFVFALWLINKSSCNLINSRKINHFIKIIHSNKKKLTLPEQYKNFTNAQIKEYFNFIDYNLDKSHLESLNLFLRLALEQNMISCKVKFDFF